MTRVSSSRPAQSVESPPGVRAKVLQSFLAFAERYEPASAARLSQTLSEAKRETIRNAASLSWLPMSLDVEVVDAVADAMGPKRFSEFARAFFLEIMPKQPLSALLELGTKLMGLSPESFLRWWSKGWEAVYRGCGTVSCSFESATRARLVFEGVPRVCVESEAFIEALLGAAYGVYTLAGTSGVVRLNPVQANSSRVELEFEWRPKRTSLPKRSRASQPRKNVEP